MNVTASSIRSDALPPVAREKAKELARRMLELVRCNATDRAAGIMTLDTAAYLDPRRFLAETELLFRRRAIFACLSVELPRPGSVKTLEIPTFPVLIVRGEDGILRAFLNACRHRGSRLANGNGEARMLVCPYHAWTYDLAGRLRGVRNEEGFGSIDKDCHDLVQIAVAERHGLVFVRATPLAVDASPIDIDYELAGLGAQFAQWRLDRLERHRSTVIPIAANWKLAVDTYLETYHFSSLHPATVAQTHFADHTTFDSYGPHQLAGFTGKSIATLAAQNEDEWEPMRHLQFIYFLFPSTVLVVMRDHIEYFRTIPDRQIDRSKTDYVYFIYQGTRFEARETADIRFERELSILIDEDCPMAENMQSTIESGALPTIQFGRNEPGLQHFHRSCSELLSAGAAGRIATAPTTSQG